MRVKIDYKYIQFKRNIRPVNRVETIATGCYWFEVKIYTFNRFIQVNQGKAYLFSEQKKNGTKHFISYSTGKHSNLKVAGIDLEN